MQNYKIIFVAPNILRLFFVLQAILHAQAANTTLLLLNDSSLQPLLHEHCGISQSLFVFHFVLIGEQIGQVLSRERLHLLSVLPEIGRTLVHADDITEVDVLLSFSDDDFLTTHVAKIKTFFCFHIFVYFLIVYML